MRNTLAGRYGDQPVGMGGVFLIEKGKAKIHVMVIFVFYWRSNGDSSQSESSTFQGSGYLKAMEKDGCLRSQNQEQPTKWEKKNS